eukprot:gb/GEZN01008581.1/.p2 GENE.gb/GEZN01008581.1/~~gb/GEZN01008581.1/.p2  ORF type:complete len:202 (+),score=38.40 gb/GEZN01008581.1/:100-705(+)
MPGTKRVRLSRRQQARKPFPKVAQGASEAPHGKKNQKKQKGRGAKKKKKTRGPVIRNYTPTDLELALQEGLKLRKLKTQGERGKRKKAALLRQTHESIYGEHRIPKGTYNRLLSEAEKADGETLAQITSKEMGRPRKTDPAGPEAADIILAIDHDTLLNHEKPLVAKALELANVAVPGCEMTEKRLDKILAAQLETLMTLM